jgi:hypothetical protein
MHLTLYLRISHTMFCLIIPMRARLFSLKENFINYTRVIDVDDFSTIYKTYTKFTERVDNTYVSSNLSPSEFSSTIRVVTNRYLQNFILNFKIVNFNHPYAYVFLKSCKLYDLAS